MFPFGWTPHGAPSNSEPSLEEAIRYLLTLVPGWARNPDLGLVQPGHTLEYEQEVARSVRGIEGKWFPKPVDPPEEKEEPDL